MATRLLCSPTQGRSQSLDTLGRLQDSGEVSAGSVQIDVTNAEDGTGSATISANNSNSVRAGSANNEIVVVFMAAGTMDGGAVSLQTPPGWGDMQRDPAGA